MKQFYCILKKIVIKIVINVEEKVHRNLLRVHDLVNWYCHLWTISIRMLCLNNNIAVPGWEEEIVQVTAASPVWGSNDFFSSILNIVDGSFQSLPLFVPESIENWYLTLKIEFYQLIVVCKSIRQNFKSKLCLSQCCFFISCCCI